MGSKKQFSWNSLPFPFSPYCNNGPISSQTKKYNNPTVGGGCKSKSFKIYFSLHKSGSINSITNNLFVMSYRSRGI
jgi:hypothetical protein